MHQHTLTPGHPQVRGCKSVVHPLAPRVAPCSVTYLIPAEPYFIVALKNNDDMETYKRDWGRNNKENV